MAPLRSPGMARRYRCWLVPPVMDRRPRVHRRRV